MITIVVRGLPAPQGSKRHVGNGRMIESSKKVGPWRDAVRGETQRAMTGLAPLDCPVIVRVTFYLPRPASAPKRVTVPAKYPDIEKLVRSTFDGMTSGGAWADDARVVGHYAEKVFATEYIPPGAIIEFDEYDSPFAHYIRGRSVALKPTPTTFNHGDLL